MVARKKAEMEYFDFEAFGDELRPGKAFLAPWILWFPMADV